MDEKKQWPKTSEWLLTVPLYREIEWDAEQVWDILDLKYFNGTIKGATLVKGGKDYEMSGTSQSTAYYTGLKVKEYCDNQK